MTDSVQGKEQSAELVPVNQSVQQRSKPVLVKMDNGRVVSSDFKYHPELMMEWLPGDGCGRSRWIEVGEVAKMFCGSSTPSTKKRIRKALPELFRLMLERNEVLICELGGGQSGRQIARFKLFDPMSEVDRQAADARLAILVRKKDQLDRAKQIIGLLEAAASESSSKGA